MVRGWTQYEAIGLIGFRVMEDQTRLATPKGAFTMPFADNKGVRLHWEEKGQGTPVLLVMGHRYSSAMWYPMIPALSAEHRVIWFDNRGTGESDSTRKASVQDLADDAFAVMDAAGVERAHLFGVSMGGGVI